MGFMKASTDDVESVLPDQGGMWFLKDALETDVIGFTILEMEPGQAGKEHSHDEQEELYYVESGAVDVTVGDKTVPLEAGEVLRVDADETRQIVNRDAPSRLVLVGAPR